MALDQVFADSSMSRLHHSTQDHHRGLEKATTATASRPWASLDVEPYVSSHNPVKRLEDQLVARDACPHRTSASCFRSSQPLDPSMAMKHEKLLHNLPHLDHRMLAFPCSSSMTLVASFETTMGNHANLKLRMKLFTSGAGNVAPQANHYYSWVASHHTARQSFQDPVQPMRAVDQEARNNTSRMKTRLLA